MRIASFGVALDIDGTSTAGVLIRGGLTLPSTRSAIQKLYGDNRLRLKFPTVFLTNGGGNTEAAKARELEKKLGVPVRTDQIILSHTPMKMLVEQSPALRDGPVLTIGRDEVKEVALSYGIKRPYLSEDLLRWNPSIWPYYQGHRSLMVDDLSGTGFKAIIVLHDSFDWGRDTQLCCDILRSDQGVLGSLTAYHHTPDFKQSVPIYFSNPDFIWANDFPVPRFGQGGFRKCLEIMYKELTGHPLKVEQQFGKPMPSTYQYATHVLNTITRKLGGENELKNVFAVGDNIASDIAGANLFGWKSILVRTGVYKDGDLARLSQLHIPPDYLSLPSYKPDMLEPNLICDDIGDAVDHIMRQASLLH